MAKKPEPELVRASVTGAPVTLVLSSREATLVLSVLTTLCAPDHEIEELSADHMRWLVWMRDHIDGALPGEDS